MFHFLSGLPRSGSTVLVALLRQNPKVHASIVSPVGQIITHAHQAMGPTNEARVLMTERQKTAILRGIFRSYYEDVGAEICFDNNRRWCANIALLHELFPESRIVCCVRDPVAIVESFERLFQANPLALSMIHEGNSNTNVYDRVNVMMRQQGVLGFAWNSLRSAFYGEHRDKLLLVEYADLCRHPAIVMREISAALGLPPFDYDFNCLEQVPGAAEFDMTIDTPNLHTVKSKILSTQRQGALPPDIRDTLPKPFWPAARSFGTLVA
jgi:sulfotransferase